ncbi:MAG: hypothetical protein RIE73_08580 [Coleofasciculus sp. C1-SOL-03]|uniref:hypothetical protein n=1 Tax=Coleofasciculus sp. C1-SOL-03 TaxID=3069522 RepID=UPI0032FF3F05
MNRKPETEVSLSVAHGLYLYRSVRSRRCRFARFHGKTRIQKRMPFTRRLL